MTNKDLIKKLQALPPDLPVHIGGHGGPIKTVVKCEYTTPAKKPKAIVVLAGA